jgi:hypothetical protein
MRPAFGWSTSRHRWSSIMPILVPIVIAVALHGSPVAETIPKLDIARECQAEVDSPPAVKACIDDENRLRQQLEKEWGTFDAADQRQCGKEAAMGGASSYAEFLTCLEMARDTRTTQSAQDPQDQAVPKPRK